MTKLISLARLATLFIAAITIIRFFIVSDMEFMNTYYMVRQVTYTVVWIIIFFFLILLIEFCLYEGPHFVHTKKRKNMKIVSYIASVACLFKTIMVITSLLPIQWNNTWLLAYNTAEVLVWSALTIFFFFFSRFTKSLLEYIEKSRYDEL